MEIIRNLNNDGNYNTKLYNLLKNIGNFPTYNSEHDLRNPLGIYNIAFGKVLSNVNEVLNLIENDDKGVNNKYSIFLESINEFIDDCYNIIKCYYPKSASSSKTKFANQWLESINKIGIKNFDASINSYVKNTKYIVNKIKHEHGRLEQVYIYTLLGECRGYFLEKSNNEVLEPDEEVHKKYKKHSTAFSYILDIMKNLATVYIVSEKTSDYLEKYILPASKSYFSQVNEDNKTIYDIVKRIWKLPLIMFPDEYQQSFTIIDVDDAKKELIVKYPASIQYINKFKKYSDFKSRLSTSGDGTSKSFTIPYFGI